ncbi:MAG: 16S rRNA (uracil(1498)-N(3))-methyltransferase [Pirellulales bacterium]
MADRYFVESPIRNSSARLVAGEAHHLAHVMRAAPGAMVTLFDGSGAEFAARVEKVGRAEIELAIVSREPVDRELPVPVTLGVALPKGDRQRWLVEKATELGIGRLVPLVTEHGNIRVSPATLAKLRRAVIEACKQCGRNRLMEIALSQPLEEFLTDRDDGGLRLIAHRPGKSCRQALDASLPRGAATQSVVLAIGPEGGFTPAEIERAQSRGWQAVDLGPRVLRVETAAVALAAAVVGRLEGPS